VCSGNVWWWCVVCGVERRRGLLVLVIRSQDSVVGRLVSRVERCKGGLGCGSSSSSSSSRSSSRNGGSGGGCAIMGLGRCHFTSAIAAGPEAAGAGSERQRRWVQDCKTARLQVCKVKCAG
jgi:hypothetical protein